MQLAVNKGTTVVILVWLLLCSGHLPAEVADDRDSKIVSDEYLVASIGEIKQALNALEFDKALEQLKTIETIDHPSVLLLQSFRHELGIGVVIDANRARELALKAAEKQNWEAAQFLAWQSITGNVGDPNLMESEQWRRRSIEWKENSAHEPVLPEIIMVPEKNGYVPRYELVNPWIQENALEQDPIAQYNLYKTLIDGRSAYANVNQAMSWLQKSADGGLPLAAKMMAFYYEHGFILQKNPRMELKYLHIAAAADDVEAQYKLGMRLADNSVSTQQGTEAAEWLERAARQGHETAAHELAELYYDGELIDEDWTRAYEFYSIAAASGHADAQYNLAWMTSYGQGTEEDKTLGIQLFKDAVDLGSRSAAMRLSNIYLNGWGTGKDPLLAVKWAEKAISMGNEYAYRTLGEVYYRGSLGEPDYEKAFHNYEQAAREGDQESQLMMGRMLFMGRGIQRDLEEALTWLRLAAQKGNAKAHMQVLKMEGFGWGTEQDLSRLTEFFRLQLESQDDLLGQKGEELLALLQKRNWDEGSSEGRLLKALRMADDPSKVKFVRKEYLNYKVEWFRERVIQPIVSGPEKLKVREYSDEEWHLLVAKELDNRAASDQRYPPKAIYQPAPVYPPGFKFFHVEDTVDLLLVIGIDGRILEHSYRKEPIPQFGEAVEAILPYWRFIPGGRGREMVATQVRISIPFRVNETQNE